MKVFFVSCTTTDRERVPLPEKYDGDEFQPKRIEVPEIPAVGSFVYLDDTVWIVRRHRWIFIHPHGEPELTDIRIDIEYLQGN